jgi:hypothetical protein
MSQRPWLHLTFHITVILLAARGIYAQDNAIQLLHKMQQALGGVEKIAAIRDFEEIVNAEAFSPSGRPVGKVRKRTRWVSPSNLRLNDDPAGQGDDFGDALSGADRK